MNTTLPVNMEIVSVGPLKGNPLLTEVEIKIAYHGANQNGSFISKATMEDMISRTLPLAPIVGRFIDSKGDFNEHDSIPTLNTETYEINEVKITEAFGAIGEKPIVYWETERHPNGEVKEYIVTNGYIWTARYPHIKQIIAEGRPHSMEIDEDTVQVRPHIENGVETGLFEITSANLAGLCILGNDIPPAFEESKISMKFSKEEKRVQNFFIEELRQALSVDFVSNSVLQGNPIAGQKDFLEEEKSSGLSVSITEIDTEEEVEHIKEAINKLDKVAEENVTSPELDNAIDETVDTLLEIEQELSIESVVVPITDEAKEIFSDLPGGLKDIRSFREKAKKLAKPFEEEKEMAKKTPEELEAEKLEMEAQGAAGAAEPAAPAQEPVAPASSEVTIPLEETPAEVTIDPTTGEEIEVAPRVSVEEKRLAIELAKYSPEELFAFLQTKMEESEAVRQAMANMLGAGEEDSTEETEEVSEDFKKKDEEEKIAETPEETPESSEEGSEEEVEEDKKKKKNIQHFSKEEYEALELKYAKLTQTHEGVLEELKELRTVFSAMDQEEKEAVLQDFPLLEDSFVEQLRTDFSKMSAKEVEEKCVLQYFREGHIGKSLNSGQKAEVEGNILSYSHEGQATQSDKLKLALDKAQSERAKNPFL